jgi:enoyl-[acyl-carrier protein] reductase I
LAFTYQNDRFEQRVKEMAAEFNSSLCFALDVAEDSQIDACFAGLQAHWPQLDGLVHAIAFAPREAIAGDFLEGISREGFRVAHDISAYSFAALAKAAYPMMREGGGAMLALTYLGAEKVVAHYNTMGLAKASLEASIRYVASSVGPANIRVNGISAGPIKTLAAAGIKGFGKILDFVESHAPLRRNVTIQDVGNTAAFLLSDLASGITGEITYVDAGFNTVAVGAPE